MVRFIAQLLAAVLASSMPFAAERNPLDPRGKIHIPIGIPNTLDTLKTFVESEGNYSPGFGSYGVYFWVYDRQTKKLHAPTMEGAISKHGLADGSKLIPWTTWRVGDIAIKTEVCQTVKKFESGLSFLVGSRVHLENLSAQKQKLFLYVAIRPIGPAGWPIHQLKGQADGKAMFVEGEPGIVADRAASKIAALPNDTIGEFAMRGEMPSAREAASKEGGCSGAFLYEVDLEPKGEQRFGFISPVLPNRRAAAHYWDGASEWAQYDLTPLNAGYGVLQPSPPLKTLVRMKSDTLFVEARHYWQNFARPVKLELPDRRWADAFHAITAHAALTMNDGAPDVAVINYNVFNRDGVYMANIMQKAGKLGLAEKAIDYFLRQPFNGRVQPEADNPGQVLWICGEHWLFTKDRAWLERVYPSIKRLAEMITYYRTSDGPHWVAADGLDFGPDLPSRNKRELRPGSCDGFHPEYTEAFDIAGVRAAALLARARGATHDERAWQRLSDQLLKVYDLKFGRNLTNQYGSYCVLWPCKLYKSGDAVRQFSLIQAQEPRGWRYFPLARAHQGLLAGNRNAGFATLAPHLEHEQMRDWFAFDEGGPSGTGGWNRVLTRWPQGTNSVAMPHGWAIAETHLLLRDCLAYEQDDQLILLAGIPPDWFENPKGIHIEALPTHFGPCTLLYQYKDKKGQLEVKGPTPAQGFVLRLPEKDGLRVNGIAVKDGQFTFADTARPVELIFP